MGVFSKLKNIFYDEEVVDEHEMETKKTNKNSNRDEDGITKELEINKPRVEEIKVIKQEVVKEEPIFEPKPVVEEKNDERELFRSERVFNFTELDDDVDLPPRRNVLNNETRVNTRLNEKPVLETPVEQPRVFKPSPVISPIYGILDKDYKKEEIVSKNDVTPKEIPSPARSYDSVRRKAYGTLEDDLEDTLNSMNKITPEEINKEETKELPKEEPNKIDEIINKIEKSTSTVSVGELEDKLEIEHFDDEDEEEEKLNIDKTMTDSTLEHDLFNLIDSMYDDKEE